MTRFLFLFCFFAGASQNKHAVSSRNVKGKATGEQLAVLPSTVFVFCFSEEREILKLPHRDTEGIEKNIVSERG